MESSQPRSTPPSPKTGSKRKRDLNSQDNESCRPIFQDNNTSGKSAATCNSLDQEATSSIEMLCATCAKLNMDEIFSFASIRGGEDDVIHELGTYQDVLKQTRCALCGIFAALVIKSNTVYSTDSMLRIRRRIARELSFWPIGWNYKSAANIHNFIVL